MASCSTQLKYEEVKPVDKVGFKESKEIDEINHCLKQVSNLRKLARFQKKKKHLNWLTKNSSKTICDNHAKNVVDILNSHSDKIGVLYEGGDALKGMNIGILNGILTVGKEKKSEDIYIIRKTSKKKVERQISDLILMKKVGLIITWGSKKFMAKVQRIQKKISFPTLVIGGQNNSQKDVFKVFPNKQNYSDQLVKGMKRKGIKRIAILTPSHYEKSEFLKTIKRTFIKNKMDIVYDIVYSSNNYDSMNMACRNIFQIDKNARWSEYQYIMRKERRKASAKGYKLNRKLVFLPAKVSYDAIFIPDNFKIVNHFAKLFEYYKMPRIPLVGTYEWRSKDLVKSKNRLLNGALFVDFVGDPKQLPSSMRKLEGINKKIDESLGIGTDYHIMGHYSSRLAYIALMSSKNKKKNIVKILKKVRIKDKFFKNSQAFIENEFNWPSFSFEVQNNKVTLGKVYKR